MRRLQSNLKISVRTIIVLLLILPIIWSEWLSLEWSSWMWNLPEAEESGVKILIVADPQLIGYQDEPKMVGWLSRWDSDRYMRRCFSKVTNHFRPDMIVFLGDLLDENVKSTEEELTWTTTRFKSIFSTYEDTQAIFIAGDNDIGGENEPVYAHLIERFDKIFPNTIEVSDRRFDFFEVAKMTMGSYQPEIVKNASRGAIKLLLSHVPVLRSVSWSTNRIFDSYSPNLILSGHDHTAEVYIRRLNSTHLERFVPVEKFKFAVSAKDAIVELKVPTVSYRMGVPKIGYGALLITPNSAAANVEYSILWMPGRYPQLFLYLVCLSISVVFMISNKIFSFSLRSLRRIIR